MNLSRYATLPGLLLAAIPALANDLFDPGGTAAITLADRQLNGSSWSAENLLDDQPATRWLSNRRDNDIVFAFDGQRSERCFSGFSLENYGSSRSIRQFMLLHTLDAGLADDTGTEGWRRVVAEQNPSGPVNHLHWGQGGRLTAIDRELNGSNWAAVHINNGSTGDFWLSNQIGNRLDFAFDTDWDGNVGDPVDISGLALYNYGGDRSIRTFQVEVSVDGSTWQKLEVPGSGAGDPDFNYALKLEGGSLDAVDREVNATSWAAANIHDGDSQSIWLSNQTNNRLDFSFDPDGDGVSGLAGDTDDLFTLEKIVLENYGSTRSVREFQILVKTTGDPGWRAVPAPGATVGTADFNFLLSHHGAGLTAVDRELNGTSWAAANIHDGASQTIWLSNQANNQLDFAFDIDGDGAPGGAGDRFAIQKIALENYGNARSMREFQVEVRTASVPGWTRIEVPGTSAGDPGFNFLSRHEGGVLSSVSSQLNAGSYAAANVHDGSPLSLWLSNSQTNTLEFAFDTDFDGNAGDAVNFSTLRMQNYGGARSVASFEVDVRIGDGAWQTVSAPGGGTVFNAGQDSAPQVWALTPQSNVTGFRLRTLGNHGDRYTGFRELELLGDAVGPGHTFTAAQDAAEQVIPLSVASRPEQVTALRLRSINNYGDTYTGVREFKILGDSITRGQTFVARQDSAEQVFTIDLADRPSGVTAVRLQTISNYGNEYTGVRELRLLGPAVSASHDFEAVDTPDRQVFELDAEDRVANVVAARLLTSSNYGSSHIGAREFELLGNAVGPSYLFTANQAAAIQSWTFSPVTARLFRLHTVENYGDSYIGAAEIGLESTGACGPLAFWHMDEQNWGAVLDGTGNGIAGIAANGADAAGTHPVFDGSPGTCRYGEFDGVDDYLSFPTAPNLAESFTIAAWIRADVLGKDQRIFADDRSNTGGFAFSLGDGGDGRLRFFSRAVRPVILDSPAVITRGTWHFVAAVHDAASRTRKIYVDGGLTPVAQDSYTGTWGVDNGPVTVGGEADGTSEGSARWRFDGAIDEVAVYRRPLSGAELAALKDETHPCAPVVNTDQGAFAFNCVEPGADALTGRLRTKSVGATFALDVVALRDSDGDNVADAIETEYAQQVEREVTFELVDTSGGGSCGAFPVLDSPVSLPLTYRATDAGRRQHAAISLDRAYRSVGCRVTDTHGAQPLVGCSVDSFSVRPTHIALQPPVLGNAGASGSPAVKVGTGFSLSVSAGPGYDGTPSIGADPLEAHAGAVAIGNLSGGFASADPSTGIATGTAFDYSEVGSFRFLPNAIRDTQFTAVDQPGDCLAGSLANTADGSGRIGCEFANPTVTDWVGRFTPDHFDVAITEHGALANTCSGFSYAGTGLVYAVDPTILITARGPGGSTTRNYTGAYNKLDASEVVLSALSGDATTVGADSATPVAVGLASGPRHLSDNGDGSQLLRLSGDTFTYARGPNERVGEFLADVSRDLVTVTDTEDGTSAAGLPLRLSPAGVPIRYGRLNVANAHGSELQTLPMPMRVEYFAGAGSGFQPNPADACTVIDAIVIADGDAGDGLLPNATCVWDAVGSSGVFACGSPVDAADQYRASPVGSDFNLNLKAPSGAASGVLRVSADAPPWLEFDWQGGGDSDPVGLATFGIYRGDPRVIFMREVR